MAGTGETVLAMTKRNDSGSGHLDPLSIDINTTTSDYTSRNDLTFNSYFFHLILLYLDPFPYLSSFPIILVDTFLRQTPVFDPLPMPQRGNHKIKKK